MVAGARVYLIDGLISDAGRFISRGIAAHGWYDASTLKEPYRIEGKKTMGLESAEQFGVGRFAQGPGESDAAAPEFRKIELALAEAGGRSGHDREFGGFRRGRTPDAPESNSDRCPRHGIEPNRARRSATDSRREPKGSLSCDPHG